MIQPDTFGKSHSWEMPEGRLTVTLVSEPERYASRDSLSDHPDDADHTWIGIHTATLVGELREDIDFDGTEAQFNTNVATSSAGGEAAFDTAKRLLEGGFDIWKRTLRWTSLSFNIGIDEIETRHSATSGKGLKITRASDGAIFRNHGGRFRVQGNQRVNREAWKSAGNGLANGEAPPPWIDFISEARQRLHIGDHRGAIVNCAIAAETAIRATFRSTFPEFDSSIANKILDGASIQTLLEKWLILSGMSKSEAKNVGKSEVHKLFDLRNSLMHSGLRNPTMLNEIRELAIPVTRFVITTDAIISERAGLPQRIFPDAMIHRSIFGT